MKKCIFCLLWLFNFQLVLCQTRNCNPDPSGKPWTVSTVDIGVDDFCTRTEFIPTDISLQTPLAESVHNEDEIWWPFIINQYAYNSCTQVAEVFYTYTYEVNRKLNTDAGDGITVPVFSDRNFNQHYTYNQALASDNGSAGYTTGFCMIRENGCPNYLDFDDYALHHGVPNGYLYWMTGSEKYLSGMQHRVSEIYQFTIGPTAASLINLKHWLNDHGRGETSGGLAIIGVWIDGATTTEITQGPYTGEYLLNFANQYTGEHALTIVGYDNNFPVSATELGAFKIANSWGTDANFGNEGFAWLPYSALVSGNLNIALPYAYTCDIYPTETFPINPPDISIFANIEHNNRSQLDYYVGHDEIIDEFPETSDEQEMFYTFSEKGNSHTMRGAYPGPIDLALNFSHFYQDDWINPFQRIFFNLKGTSECLFGNIHSVKLIDKRWNEEFELPFQNIDHSIEEGDNWSYVDYYLLTRPEHNFIGEDLVVYTNRVSRFSTELRGWKTLTLSDSKEIHMYNSKITVNNNANLVLQENSKIVAKRGWCILEIWGNIYAENFVEFIAEEDAVLVIDFKGLNYEFDKATFKAINGGEIHLIFENQQANLSVVNTSFLGIHGGYVYSSFNNELGSVNLDSSTFTYADVFNRSNLTATTCTFDTPLEYFHSNKGNVTFLNSTFINHGINVWNEINGEKIRIEDCTFNSTVGNNMDAIIISGFEKYLIQNCTIENYNSGINLSYSGVGRPEELDQDIINNTVFNCQLDGLNVYNSSGRIVNNNIHNNYFGIRFMNNCNFELKGNQDAKSYSETQQIFDNSGIEVYAASLGFPKNFTYNSIRDWNNLGNPNDPLVLWDAPKG